jgi:hypothetical protein
MSFTKLIFVTGKRAGIRLRLMLDNLMEATHLFSQFAR